MKVRKGLPPTENGLWGQALPPPLSHGCWRQAGRRAVRESPLTLSGRPASPGTPGEKSLTFRGLSRASPCTLVLARRVQLAPGAGCTLACRFPAPTCAPPRPLCRVGSGPWDRGDEPGKGNRRAQFSRAPRSSSRCFVDTAQVSTAFLSADRWPRFTGRGDSPVSGRRLAYGSHRKASSPVPRVRMSHLRL